MNVQTNLSWLLFEKVLESNRDKVYLIHKVLHKTKWKQNNVVKENFGKTVKNWCSHFLSLSFKHMRTWLFIFAGTSQGPLPLDIWLTYWILFATAYWKKNQTKHFKRKKLAVTVKVCIIFNTIGGFRDPIQSVPDFGHVQTHLGVQKHIQSLYYKPIKKRSETDENR